MRREPSLCPCVPFSFSKRLPNRRGTLQGVHYRSPVLLSGVHYGSPVLRSKDSLVAAVHYGSPVLLSGAVSGVVFHYLCLCRELCVCAVSFLLRGRVRRSHLPAGDICHSFFSADFPSGVASCPEPRPRPFECVFFSFLSVGQRESRRVQEPGSWVLSVGPVRRGSCDVGAGASWRVLVLYHFFFGTVWHCSRASTSLGCPRLDEQACEVMQSWEGLILRTAHSVIERRRSPAIGFGGSPAGPNKLIATGL